MWKYLLIAFFLCISCGSRSYAAPDVMPLSLQQCIELALKNNIEVLTARARQEQAAGQRDIEIADLLPQIDAVASQQRTWWENIGALGFPGFTGVHCQDNVDDCDKHNCQNGATCLDGISSYTCQCPPSFTGTHCHIVSHSGIMKPSSSIFKIQ